MLIYYSQTVVLDIYTEFHLLGYDFNKNFNVIKKTLEIIWATVIKKTYPNNQ